MKIEIDINVPEGWELVDYRPALSGECILNQNGEIELARYNRSVSGFIVNKKVLRRRIFECISEEPRRAREGEWFEIHTGTMYHATSDGSAGKYKIWREVDESEES